MPRQQLPQLIDDTLRPLPTNGKAVRAIVVGSREWFDWLEAPENRAFSIQTDGGAVTVRREQQSGGWYWYAYRRNGPKLRKTYLGRVADVTFPRLQAALQKLRFDHQTPVGEQKPLYLRLLGTPHAMQGGQPIALPSSKAVALLACLALSSMPQSRDHLLALLWPESAEEAARKNLRNVLWSIRTTFGAELLVTQGERLSLQADAPIDLRAFEQLATSDERADLKEALELYRGPLLDGLHLAEAADFDLWLATERERLLQLFCRASEHLIEWEKGESRWDEVVAIAQRVLMLDPLQEWPYRTLMEAHARRGDRATALRHYELLRAMLERELDVVPSAESEAVHDAIVRGTFDRAAVRAPQLVPVRMNQPSVAPFIGRERERTTLDQALAATMGGSLGMVVLSGEMGIGKSRLWQVWAADVPVSVTVLEARCLLSTRPMPFAPLINLFSHRIWLDRFAAVASTAPPAWMEELSPLVPTLQETLARPLLSRLQPADERHRVFEAFVQALQAIAAPPLVFFLDDVQWADSTTLDWLDYLMHRGGDLSLLVVLAYRTEDVPRSLLQRIAQWDRDRLVRRVALQRLTEGEGAALLAALGGQDDAERLYKASAGNPYFLSELAQAPHGDLPPAVADLLRARLESLPEPARQILQAAAVLEPDIDAATIWRIAGSDEDQMLDALDTLLHAAILIEYEDRYAFAHPLLATLVRDELSRARRATLHRRAATALEQRYADRLFAQAGRIMAHFREAGDMPQTGRYAEMAGDYALSVAAPTEAAHFYTQAIAIESTAARQLGWGRAELWRGDLDSAWNAIQQALTLFKEKNDRSGAAWASLQLADIGTMRSQFDTSMELAEQALQLAGEENQAIAAAAHVLIGTGLRIQGAPLAEAEAHVLAAIHLATEADLADILTYCYVGLSNIRAEQGDMQGAFVAAHEIVRYARLSGNDFYEAVGYNNAAHRALLLGNLIAAHNYLEAGLRLVEERALEVPRQWLYSTRGELALAENDWDEAEQWFQRGIVQAERAGNGTQIAMYHANLGRASRGRGDLDAAARLLEKAANETDREAAASQHVQIGLWLAETYLLQGRHDAAETVLLPVEAHLVTGAFPHLQPLAAMVRERLPRIKTQRRIS